jgi:hypothetical protein
MRSSRGRLTKEGGSGKGLAKSLEPKKLEGKIFEEKNTVTGKLVVENNLCETYRRI